MKLIQDLRDFAGRLSKANGWNDTPESSIMFDAADALEAQDVLLKRVLKEVESPGSDPYVLWDMKRHLGR